MIGIVQQVPDKRRQGQGLDAGWQPPSRARLLPMSQSPVLVLMGDMAARASFPVIQTMCLESFRSSITFRFDTFEFGDPFGDPWGALHLNGNRIKGLAFDGERGRCGSVFPPSPHLSRLAPPPPPDGSPAGSPDASD